MTKAAEKKDEGTPVVEKGKHHLECKLTKDELSLAGKLLAEAIQRKQAIEKQLESYRTQAKADVAEADAVISKQTQLVASEKEFRYIDVETTFDFKAGKKTAIRQDTKEVVYVREISNEERQQKLV